MSEVHCETQEEEDEATLALLPSKSYQQTAGRQAGRPQRAHTEILDGLTPQRGSQQQETRIPSLFS